MFYLINSDIFDFKIGILIQDGIIFLPSQDHYNDKKGIERHVLRIMRKVEESQVRQEISIFFCNLKKEININIKNPRILKQLSRTPIDRQEPCADLASHTLEIFETWKSMYLENRRERWCGKQDY